MVSKIKIVEKLTAGPISPLRPRGPGGPMGPGIPFMPSLPGEPLLPEGPCKQKQMIAGEKHQLRWFFW